MVHPDLRVKIGPLELKNPVITASGTFGYGREFSSLMDLDLLGGIVVKGISLKPREGNPPPRIVETPCGMLNAIGLANVGLRKFPERKAPLAPGAQYCRDCQISMGTLWRSMEQWRPVSVGLRAYQPLK